MLGNLIFCFMCCVSCLIEGRSPHRPQDPSIPTIITHWLNNTTLYTLQDFHLRYAPYFMLYDKNHVDSHLLPTGPIAFRYDPQQTISGEKLSAEIEHLLQEARQGKTTFTNFTVLKQWDFDWKTNTGLVIARSNNYPFVIKLSIETPESFIDPMAKGFEPMCFFMMAGGVHRHLTGFTRIKNLDYLQARIHESSVWKNRISFPRKWFWLPKDNRLIAVSGKHLGQHTEETIYIPSVYAIVSDCISIERTLELFNKNDRHLAMSLSNYLNQNIDPHINNYVIEVKTRNIVPLDTEYFPILVGYTDAPTCKSYFHWYVHLAKKFFNETMMRNKQQRKIAQNS